MDEHFHTFCETGKGAVIDLVLPTPEVEVEELDYTQAPPKAGNILFPGIIGDCVRAVTEKTEAVPVAVAANLMGRIAAMIGRPSKQTPKAPKLYVGDSSLNIRPFYLLVGPSAKGRKGTSDKPAARIMQRVDEVLFERHSKQWPGENKSPLEQFRPLNTHVGGLSTGEGLSYFLRDDSEDKNGDPIPGQPDKRLFVIEEEFANVLAQCRRDHNTLSATVRRLWDGQTLSPLTKSERNTATDPHVCISGHITVHELVEKSTGNDIANGFLNRFILLYTKREQIIAFPERTDSRVIDQLAGQIADCVSFAQQAGVMALTPQARDYWEKEYIRLTTLDNGHLINSMFARSESYCLMLASLFALLDRRNLIEVQDMESASAWVEYWRHSLVYIFDGERRRVEAQQETSFADQVLEVIHDTNHGQGCTRTQINNHFNGRKATNELSDALERLLSNTPPKIRMELKKGRGRPSKIYLPCGKSGKTE